MTDNLIVCRAIFVKESMHIDTKCHFSNGWLENFKNRYNIVTRKAGSKIVKNYECELDVMLEFVKLVNNKIKSNEFDSILNLDETATYYDSKIDFTLDIKGNKRIEIKTTGREKQRVTSLLGVDYFSKIKMKPLIILKGKTKRCINNIPLNDDVNLTYQENAWCTEDQLIQFISYLPKDKKILLLYDNFRGHTTKKVLDFIKENLPLVEVIMLPPYTTSILQPLDIGINKSFKSHIKKEYINFLIENYDKNKSLPNLTKTERNKLLVEWITNSWNNIDNDIIKKSFGYCGYGIPPEIDPEWKKFYKT